MTEKELHRLGREGLLQLLVDCSKENTALQKEIGKKDTALMELQEGYDRLKEKLGDKDAQLERLKNKLDQKDTVIEELQREIQALREQAGAAAEVGADIAEAALRLNRLLRQSRTVLSARGEVPGHGYQEEGQQEIDLAQPDGSGVRAQESKL